MKTVSRNIPLI